MVNKTQEKKIKKAIKENKKQKAKFQRPSVEELKEVITGKLADYVHRQITYRDTIYRKILRERELKEMIRQYKDNDIKIDWYGMVMPKDILEVQIEILRNGYKDLIRELNKMQIDLTKDGLSLDQINQIPSGKLYKIRPADKEQ